MKKIRLKNKMMAFALCAVTLVAALGSYKASAAGYIDEDKSCSVTISLPDTVTDMAEGDSTTVRLYKIGDIDKTGTLTSDIDGITYTSGMTADDMLQAVDTAKAWVKDNNKTEDYSFNIGSSKAGSTTGDISKAIYLMTVDDLVTKKNTYTFESAILSLPSNEYGITSGALDDWIYNVSQTVKCESRRNLVDLTIEKNLPLYNASLGTASFVYEVTAYDSDDAVVFSDVYSINMNQAGTASVNTGEVIPTGCRIEVKEVYTGASYSIDSADNATVTIEDGLLPDSEPADRTVSFTNNYNDKLITGGISVTNTYTKSDEGYTGANDLTGSADGQEASGSDSQE